jgi:pyruvate/2-oxoglutarate dehydrogenase complex dihydrolipoamide dehydrogenase (E3) component
LKSKVVRLEPRGTDKVVVIEQDGEEIEVVGDQILVGIGRAPNVDGLGLEKVNVEYDTRRGIVVNDRLQSTNPRIYAAGDVASRFKFTHAADFMARIVIQNALFFGRAKASDLIIPWTTFTSPELAHVGLYPREAEEQNIAIDTYTQPFSGVDRAILDGEADGFVRVHVKKGTDKILGATIVATNAGDMIGELTLAMKNGIGLKAIGATIHPYPTQAEAIRKLGDMYGRTRLTPFVKSVFNKWLSWTR